MSTEKEKKRFRQLHDLGCICCLVQGIGYVPPDTHHIVDKGYRRLSGGHQATIPICPWHHRGLPPSGMSVDDAFLYAGPSLALHKKHFNEIYGGERQLLALVNGKLARNAA